MSGEKLDLKVYMHPNIHCSIIYNSQDMESTLMSIGRGINKYHAAIRKNKVTPFIATWMHLDIITLSEAN